MINNSVHSLWCYLISLNVKNYLFLEHISMNIIDEQRKLVVIIVILSFFHLPIFIYKFIIHSTVSIYCHAILVFCKFYIIKNSIKKFLFDIPNCSVLNRIMIELLQDTTDWNNPS